ncbi:MAG: SurA N-terminal domain-containing protein [Motilibacteraceae bacterium]
MPSSRLRPLAAVALAAALAAGSAGCSAAEQAQQRIGAAAVVGDQRISVDRLQTLTQQLQQAISGSTDTTTPGDLQRQVLTTLVSARLIDDAAKAKGITATPGEVDALVQRFARDFAGQENVTSQLAIRYHVPPSFIREYARLVVLAGKLGQQAAPGDLTDPNVAQKQNEAILQILQETAKREGVDVSPRYGTWDPTNAAVQQLISGGLAQPEGAATTPASGQ